MIFRRKKEGQSGKKQRWVAGLLIVLMAGILCGSSFFVLAMNAGRNEESNGSAAQGSAEPESSAQPEVQNAPPYLVPYADMEAEVFRKNSGISYYLKDYLWLMRPKNIPSRMSLKTIGYTDLPGVPKSEKALACIINPGKRTGDMFGVRFGGSSKIGTFDSFTKKGNVSDKALKDSGVAFFLDLSDYSENLSLQFNMSESDCTSGGSFTGRLSSYRLEDRYSSVKAILEDGQTVILDAYEQHIQVPANFVGWIMIPFADMQRVRFNSYDINRSFDLRNIESVTFFFPLTENSSGRIYFDEISFYGPFFREKSKEERPAEDKNLAHKVQEDLQDTAADGTAPEDEKSKPVREESSAERVPFSEQHPVALWVLLGVGLLCLIAIFTLSISGDLLGRDLLHRNKKNVSAEETPAETAKPSEAEPAEKEDPTEHEEGKES